MVHEIALTSYRAGYCGTRGMLSLGTWGSYGREQLHISTDDSWAGLVVTVHFCTGTGVTPVLVGADGLVDVPPEATASPGMGNIVVDGTADGQRIYSVNVPYIVLNHADVDGAEPPAAMSLRTCCKKSTLCGCRAALPTMSGRGLWRRLGKRPTRRGVAVVWDPDTYPDFWEEVVA